LADAFQQSAVGLHLFSTAEYDTEADSLLVLRTFSPYTTSNQKMVVFFSMNLTALREMLTSMFPDEVQFAIVAPDGQMLLESVKNDTLHYDRDTLKALMSGTGTEGPNGETLCRYATSEKSYSYLLLVSNTSIQSSLTSYIRSSRIFLFFSIFLSLFLVGAAVYIAYKPLHGFLSCHVSSHPNSQESEFELLESKFDSMDKDLMHQRVLLSNFILDDLLFGSSVDADILERHFPTDLYHSFVVATVDCTPLSTDEAKFLISGLETQLPLRVFLTVSVQSPQTIFIFCILSEKFDPMTALKEPLCRAIEAQGHIVSSVTLGSPVDRIAEIRSSYSEAQKKASTALAKEEKLKKAYPATQIQELIDAITAGNVALVDELLDSLQETCSASSLSIGQRKLYCYRFLDTLLPYIQDTDAYRQTDTEELLNFFSMPSFFTILHHLLPQCAAEKQTNSVPNTPDTKELLIAYLDEHFRNKDLCLNSVADAMNLSIYTVSRLYKEATGRGFKEYITEKRLTYACRLLKTTDLSIAAIASQSGFSDSSYFSAIFKRTYGMPPNMYRDHYLRQNTGNQAQ
jgi:AraC-like DNA-binding protein